MPLRTNYSFRGSSLLHDREHGNAHARCCSGIHSRGVGTHALYLFSMFIFTLSCGIGTLACESLRARPPNPSSVEKISRAAVVVRSHGAGGVPAANRQALGSHLAGDVPAVHREHLLQVRRRPHAALVHDRRWQVERNLSNMCSLSATPAELCMSPSRILTIDSSLCWTFCARSLYSSSVSSQRQPGFSSSHFNS